MRRPPFECRVSMVRSVPMRWLVGAAMCVVLGAIGCSAPKSRVHGRILYKGKPVALGTVIFISPDNSTSQARIAEDGSYEIQSASRGLIHVSIQAGSRRPSPRPPPNSRAAALKAKSAPGKTKADDESKMAIVGPPRDLPATDIFPPGLSAQYGDPNKSGLSFELTNSDQEWSVDLK
jgi:hypothetical protein